MVEAEGIVAPPGAVVAAKDYLRVHGTGEDALLERLAVAAIGLAEEFCGTLLVQRGVSERLRATGGWQRLGAMPVTAVLAVTDEARAGVAHDMDIDASGDGWVKAAGGARMRVAYVAGRGAAWDDLPEPVRQAIVRLIAYFYMQRDEVAGGSPPAAVTALLRPWRRMRLA